MCNCVYISGKERNTRELATNLESALEIVTKGLHLAKRNGNFFMIFAVLSLFAAYGISVIHIPYPLDYFVTIIQVVLVLTMGFGLVHTFVTIRGEVHGLETTREDIKNLLDSTNNILIQNDS